MTTLSEWAAGQPATPATPANDKTPTQRDEAAVESRADALEVLLGVRGMVLDGQSALAIVERLDEVINALPSREIWTSPTNPWNGQPAQRNAHDILTSLAQLAEENLAELKHVRAALASGGSVSSVEVKTSARGTDITCKAYAGSDIESAGDAAVSEYQRVRSMLEDKLMNGEKAHG